MSFVVFVNTMEPSLDGRFAVEYEVISGEVGCNYVNTDVPRPRRVDAN